MTPCPSCNGPREVSDRYCKPCRNTYNREWNKANPAKARNIKLQNKFGMSSRQWEELFNKQGRACAICKSPDPKTRVGWHTDHDYRTNKVRGILCHACNVRLGIYEAARDNPAIRSYLRRKQI